MQAKLLLDVSWRWLATETEGRVVALYSSSSWPPTPSRCGSLSLTTLMGFPFTWVGRCFFLNLWKILWARVRLSRLYEWVASQHISRGWRAACSVQRGAWRGDARSHARDVTRRDEDELLLPLQRVLHQCAHGLLAGLGVHVDVDFVDGSERRLGDGAHG